MLMFTNKEAGLLINVIGESSTTKQLTGDYEKVFGIWSGFLAPIIVTGKISLHVTVRRNITYDEHVNHDIQQHSAID